MMWKCGDVMGMWRCYGSVEMLWECGDVMEMRRCYGNVKMYHILSKRDTIELSSQLHYHLNCVIILTTLSS